VKPPKVSIVVLLLGTAASGLVTGWLLRQTMRSREEPDVLALAENIAKRATPMGDPSRSAVDIAAPDPRSLEGIPPYPQAAPRGLARMSRVGGIPLSASWFSTKDPVETVMAFYEAAFEPFEHRASHRDGEGIGYVSYREDASLPDGGVDSVLRMVTVVPQNGSTLVLVSNSQPQRVLEKPAAPDGVFLPASAAAAHVIESNELEGRFSTISTSVPEPLGGTEATFSAGLEKAGWQVNSRSANDEARTRFFVAERNSQRQFVWLEEHEGATNVVIQFHDKGATP
jgi:hypothetical protein